MKTQFIHSKRVSLFLFLLSVSMLLSISLSSAAIDVVLNNSDVTVNTTYRGEISITRLGGYPRIRLIDESVALGNESDNSSEEGEVIYKTIYSWTVNSCPVQDDWISPGEDSNITCSFVTYADDLRSGRYSYIIGVEDWAGNERFDEKNFTVELPIAIIDENCYNDITDGTETDLNCGGSGCLCCESQKKCNNDTDCCSYYCRQGYCAEPRCDDLIRNGFESDVDCGGSCPLCEDGNNCTQDSDCLSNFCNNQGKCAYPRCDDGTKNGFESDVDCGGANCSKCSNSMSCNIDSDCESDFCEAGFCACDKSIDTDGDGMDDCWEIKYGLDPDDIDDADGDLDDDGVSNLDEYLDQTDPTDPTDPGREESHLLGIILLIIGILIVLGSTGFLIYSRKVLLPKERSARQRQQPAGMPGSQPGSGTQQPGFRQIGATRPQQRGGKSSIAQALAQRRLAQQQGKGSKPASSPNAPSSAVAGSKTKPSRFGPEKDDSDGFIPLSELNKANSKGAQKEVSGAAAKDKEKSSEDGKQVKLSSVFDRLKELTSPKDKPEKGKDEKKG